MIWKPGYLAAAMVFLFACGDNKATLIDGNGTTNGTNANNVNSNNTSGSNNTTGANNTTGSNNNSSNNANNTTNTNNNTGNNLNNSDDIYDVVPATDDRDYEGTLPMRPTEEVQAFVYDMAEAFCAKVVVCRGDYEVASHVIQKGIATKGDCIQDFLNRNNPDGYAQSVVAGNSEFFADSAALCPQEILNAGCDRIARAFNEPRVEFQACSDALVGLARVGDVCYSNADCTGVSTCALGSGLTCEGTCERVIELPQLCGANADIPCALTEYCDAGDQTCKTFKMAGDACALDAECSAGNFCRNGACAAVKLNYQLGQPCNDTSNFCAMGLYCDAPPGEIGVCAELRGVGEDCEFQTDCSFLGSCVGSTCLGKFDEGTCLESADCLSAVCQSDSTCLSSTAACTPKLN